MRGRSGSADVADLAEVGKWLLQLATAFAVAGAVSAVLREVENLRAQRAAWAGLLHDVIQANDTVLVARLLLAAHANAKTYSEQIQELIRARATLRRVAADPDVHKSPELRDAINQMSRYLAELALEYEKRYLPVARQQRVDEERLKLLAQEAAKTPAPEKLTAEELAAELRQPMRAGQMLEDAGLFPDLAAFRDGGSSRTAISASAMRLRKGCWRSTPVSADQKEQTHQRHRSSRQVVPAAADRLRQPCHLRATTDGHARYRADNHGHCDHSAELAVSPPPA